MKNLTLRQFRYFEALAQEGHFGRAADVCAISQPALSLQIKDLEKSLGGALVERGSRHVRLTAFGETVRAKLTPILQSVDDLEDWVRTAREGVFGRLRMGVIPTLAPYILPRLIADLSVAFPGLDLHVRETITPRLVHDLSEGRLDAALVALPVSEPGFDHVALFTEEFVLVRPIADAGLPVPSSDELRTMRLLLLEEGHCFREQALALCGLAGARPRDMLEGSALATLVQMVGAGLGVTLIPEMAVPVETRSAPVTIVRFGSPAPTRRIGLVFRKTHPLSERLRQVAATIAASVAALRQAQTLSSASPALAKSGAMPKTSSPLSVIE